MQQQNLFEDIAQNQYPGRGIIIGKSADGKKAVVAYFIMGRSVNSRNRVFVLQGNDMKTKAFDETKLSDPSLIIYNPVRKLGNTLIVTNGDQTDTIFDYLADGKTFEEALRTRTFEPDPPNYTPRISGVIHFTDQNFSYKLSILKSAGGNADSVQRFFYEYDAPLCGEAHFIHTYQHDGDPIPSFCGEPKTMSLTNTESLDLFAEKLWDSLHYENKVSLFVQFIDLINDKSDTKIINKLN